MSFDLDVERELGSIAPQIQFPPQPDIAAPVMTRIAALPAPRAWRWRSVVWTRRSIALAAAMVVVAGGIATGTYLGVRGVRIHYGPTPTPIASGAHLELGKLVSPAEARARASFPVRVPAALGAPDETYFTLVDFSGGRVSLVYRPRVDLPEIGSTKAGALLLEFEARLDRDTLIGKFVDPRQLDVVSVGGATGFWIEGAHSLAYLDDRGRILGDPVQVVGNVLLWQVGPVTLRLETMLAMADAVRIAESIR